MLAEQFIFFLITYWSVIGVWTGGRVDGSNEKLIIKNEKVPIYAYGIQNIKQLFINHVFHIAYANAEHWTRFRYQGNDDNN